MIPIQALTVYCSSSNAVESVYVEAAADLGQAIVRSGWKLVYGGNSVGMMQTLADAVRASGGKVIGVTPQVLVDKGIHDIQCDELVVTTGMRERKAIMEERGDAFIALPGGLGTLEEIFEIIVGKQLGYHDKPIVLLNVADYYGPLLAMLEHGIEQKFIKSRARELYFVATTVTDAIEYIRNYAPRLPSDEWIKEAIPSAVE